MKKKFAPYLFLSPVVIIMVVFIYTPIVQGFINSLFRWNAIDPDWTFIGFDNYARLFGDEIFWRAFKNNVWFAIISVLFQVLIALILAAILESNLIVKRVSTFFRTVLFLPSVLAVTVVGVTWNLLYRPQQGLINQLLDFVGLGSLTNAWLGKEATAIFSIIGVSQWQYVGYTMVLFIVAIQAIDPEIYEAARIDGANAFHQFIYITIPSMRESIMVITTITIIGAFKVFDIIWVMTAGGPNNASQVISTYMYKSGFRIDEMGYASAISMVVFVLTFTLTTMQLYIARTGQEV